MKIYYPILIFIVLTACSVKNQTENATQLPIRWPHAVTYEVFVQSFADSNGDGIGDLKGLTSKLDYIAELGVEAIWLMPINPSPSYHKYDVTDYYGIHSDYGTLDDFKELLAEAHKRNLKIIIDLVINHCSSEHEWFQSATEPDGDYRDFFVWANMEEIEAEGNLIKAATGDSDNINQWNKIADQEELYFSFFWYGMPDLNYDNPKVREEVYKIGKYWLTEIGIDGFRLDAAKHIYPDHRAEDNHTFWKEFKETMTSYKPDAYTIGEVWATLETQAPFAQGFSALFNFDLSYSILESVKNEHLVSANIHESSWKVEESGSPVALCMESEKAFLPYNPNFINASFLSNHDQDRVFSFLGNDMKKAKLAASILMTLPGAPYIYYGEELGMKGKKPDEYIREPFIWSPGEDAATTKWMKVKYNKSGPVNSVEAQKTIKSSMYNYYKTLIHLRRTSEVLSRGTIQPVINDDDQLLTFIRQIGDSKLWVIHNLSGMEKSIPQDEAFGNTFYESTTANNTTVDPFLLPAFSTVIFSN